MVIAPSSSCRTAGADARLIVAKDSVPSLTFFYRFAPALVVVLVENSPVTRFV